MESSDSHLEHLKSCYKPLNKFIPGRRKLNSMESADTTSSSEDSQNVSGSNDSSPSQAVTDELPKPKKDIFDSRNLELEWKSRRGVGAGLCNLGNTCFLNSVLQCLLYTSPLYNYLNSVDHKQKCEFLSHPL